MCTSSFPASVWVHSGKSQKDPAERVDSCSRVQRSAKSDSEALEMWAWKNLFVHPMLQHSAYSSLRLRARSFNYNSRLTGGTTVRRDSSSGVTLMGDVVTLQSTVVHINSWTRVWCRETFSAVLVAVITVAVSALLIIHCSPTVSFKPHILDLPLLQLCSFH